MTAKEVCSLREWRKKSLDAQTTYFKSYVYIFIKVEKTFLWENTRPCQNIPLGILKKELNHYRVHKRERLGRDQGWQTNKKIQLQAKDALVLSFGTGKIRSAWERDRFEKALLKKVWVNTFYFI